MAILDVAKICKFCVPHSESSAYVVSPPTPSPGSMTSLDITINGTLTPQERSPCLSWTSSHAPGTLVECPVYSTAMQNDTA